MRKYWLLWSDRFNALKPRERGIAFALLAVCLSAAMYLFALEPALKRQTAYKLQLEQNEILLTQLKDQEVALIQQSLLDPDAQRQQQLAALAQGNQAIRGELAEVQMRLAPPQRMGQLLSDLLARQPGLELISAKTLEPENLLEQKPGTAEAVGASAQNGPTQIALSPIAIPAPSAANAPASSGISREKGVYRHGLEITVRGNYLNLAAYARRVEQMPWKLYWGPMNLHVDRYPDSTLTFVVYTLSLDPAWLSL